MSQLDDPGRLWRERSEAARRDAALMTNPAARLRLLEIAAAYDRLAAGDLHGEDGAPHRQ